MTIDGEGMPFMGNPFTKGKLYILFTVEFPKKSFSDAHLPAMGSGTSETTNLQETINNLYSNLLTF